MAWGAKEVAIVTGLLVGGILLNEFVNLSKETRAGFPWIVILGEGIFWFGVKEVRRASRGR